MWRIQQEDDEWIVFHGDAEISRHASWELAIKALGGAVQTALAAQAAATDGQTTTDGLLPERWVSAPAICFSAATGDGRDFSECTWTWRDPATAFVPLMLQTCTDYGHFGAELAGFVEEFTMPGADPQAAGRFYDSPIGVQFRDMLLGGRRFSVSVDPGAVAVDWRCDEVDDDGWCIAETAFFIDYEIIGVTGTPFAGFAEAGITLDPATVQSDGVAASAIPPAPARTITAAAPVRPPRAWFERPEPADDSDLLVEQPDGALAVPLTITAEGAIFGHVRRDDQCHIGYPGQCVQPPPTANGYASFNLGHVLTAEGADIPTGAFVVGCDHALGRLRAPEARDHYAHAGLAWADAHVIQGRWGPWFAGALRPDVDESQLRVLRGCSISGDWREEGTQLELVAAQAVSVPGYPIARSVLYASGVRQPAPARGPRVVTDTNGRVLSLVASGVVHRCKDCARRQLNVAEQTDGFAEISTMVRAIERRTRHLVPAAVEAELARIERISRPANR